MSYVARLSRQGRRLAAERAAGGRRSLPAAAAFGAIALCGAGLIVADAVAGFGERRDPPMALAAAGGDASALAQVAQARVDSRGGPESLAEAERLANASLRAQALNPAAFRVLGEVADARGDKARAVALFRAAARLTRRDTITGASLLADDLQRGDVVAAVRQADVILRYAPEVSNEVFPPLAQMARDAKGQPTLAQQLATRPAWRPGFLTFLAGGEDPNVALDLMGRLADLGAPATDAEISPLLNRMVDHHQYLQAFLAWQQLSPGAATRLRGNVRDGDFDGQAGAPPFGWNLQNSSGASAEILQGPTAGAAGSALKVSYDGVSIATPARQLMILGPGVYHLAVKAYVSAPRAATHLGWTVRCAEDNRPLASTPDLALDPGWNTLGADFAVPAGCEGQWLSLTAIPGEHSDDVEVWYDALEVRRTALAPA
ncbi:hypothetical protein ACO2Q3_05430 [Caulobacter sp. KR2-114]|uniref:hypothetical protein n=1 Tax=Caulobacter sp. KR2-114 TaxID=3400912 RepID=UPI003C0767D6